MKMGDEYTAGALTRAISKKSKKKKSTEKKPLEDLFATPDIAVHFTPKSVKSLTKKEKPVANSEESEKATEKKSPKSIKRKKLEEDSDEESLPVNRKKRKKQIPRDPKEEERTVFVGNLPNSLSLKKLQKLFKKYGDVETARIRSAAVADPEMPKKLAVIRRDFHPERKNMNAYVRFKTEQGAKEALKLNGHTLDGFCLRVDLATKEKQHDNKRCIFLGNLPFSIEENIVHSHFEDCGDIEGVRVIRDSRTGIGKGFGYVQFQKSESVELALKLDGSQLVGRQIRVFRAQKKQKAKSIIDAIEMVQRRAARFVKGDYQLTSSVTEMLKTLQWDSLRSRRENLRIGWSSPLKICKSIECLLKLNPTCSTQDKNVKPKYTGTGETLQPGTDKKTRKRFFSTLKKTHKTGPPQALKRNATMRIAKGLKKKKRKGKITN